MGTIFPTPAIARLVKTILPVISYAACVFPTRHVLSNQLPLRLLQDSDHLRVRVRARVIGVGWERCKTDWSFSKGSENASGLGRYEALWFPCTRYTQIRRQLTGAQRGSTISCLCVYLHVTNRSHLYKQYLLMFVLLARPIGV